MSRIQQIKSFAEAMVSQRRRERRVPRVGEAAPDFELADVSGENAIRLSALKGEYVGLVFGSFT